MQVRELGAEGGIHLAEIDGTVCFRAIDVGEAMFPYKRPPGEEHKPNGPARIALADFQKRHDLRPIKIRKGLPRVGNYLPVSVQQPLMQFMHDEHDQVWSRFHAYATARRNKLKETTVNAVSTIVAQQPLYTVSDEFRLRVTENKRPTRDGIIVHTAHGDVPVVLHDERVFVCSEFLSMRYRKGLTSHAQITANFKKKHGDVDTIRCFVPGRSKALPCVDIRRLDDLVLACFGGVDEDRSNAHETNTQLLAAVDAWQSIKGIAGQAPAPEPEPEPAPEVVEDKTAETQRQNAVKAISETPKLIRELIERVANLEDAVPPVEVLNEILVNQRTIMKDHATLLAVLGGLANGAVDALNAARGA